MDRVAYKSSSIYQKIKNDKFPKPRVKRPGFTAWHESDINLFLVYFENEDPNLSWSKFLEKRNKNDFAN